MVHLSSLQHTHHTSRRALQQRRGLGVALLRSLGLLGGPLGLGVAEPQQPCPPPLRTGRRAGPFGQ